MLKKGSKLNSILTGTCPKCQNESMYKVKNPLNLSKVLDMNEKCSYCNLKYQIEPSFFYGAIIVTSLVLQPFVLRLARNIYINMFVSYDPKTATE